MAAQRDEIDTEVRFEATAPSPRVKIHVESDAAMASDRTMVVDADLVRIGSHPSNDLVLEDPSVSRFHVHLARRDSGWLLTDIGSTNGTIVRGVRMVEALLPPGQTVLHLGDSRVRVEEAGVGAEVALLTQPKFGEMFGRSIEMRKLFALLEKVAARETNVLIEGESGTGKELVASEIVRRSARARGPMVVVDCGAVAPNLIESELFGHARGAFTGASRDRVGAFEAASGGTLFLDEIGELPFDLQPKLLRAIEAREVRRLGETTARKLDVRVIAATNRMLEREVNEGRFREDLYFRVSVVTVRVPALRDHPDDIPLLVRAFLTELGAESSAHLFTDDVLDLMRRHRWSGNVRELRNFVERTIVLEHAEPPPPMPPSTEPVRGGVDLSLSFRDAKEDAIARFEEVYLRALLVRARGNISLAARTASMDRMHLHRLSQRYELRPGRGLRD